MPAGLPQTKFNELHRELALLLRPGGTVDPITIKRYEKQAALLRSTQADVAGGWELQGYISALRGDVAGIADCCRRAKHAPGRDEWSTTRFAWAALLINETELAHKIALEACAEEPDNKEVILEALNISGDAGFILQATTGTNHAQMEWALNTLGITEDEVAAAVKNARRFMRAQGTRVAGSRVWVTPDSEEPVVCFQLQLDTDVDRALELEQLLFEHLAAEEIPVEASGSLVFLVSSDPVKDDDGS